MSDKVIFIITWRNSLCAGCHGFVQTSAPRKMCIMVVLESERSPMFPTLFFVRKLNPSVVLQNIFLSFSFDVDSYLQHH